MFTMENLHTEVLPDTEDDLTSPANESVDLLRFIVDLFETILLSVILFLAIDTMSARIRVDGYSMEPTLDDGQYVLVNKLSYWLGEPRHGDIVVFHFPRGPEEEYIKRVVGLPGEKIAIRNGEVTVNGYPLSESYIKASPAYVGEWVVPDDALFVLGDNRNNSSDSHNWGWVPMENVIGKAVFVYWPPQDWGALTQPIQVLAAP